MSKSHSSAASFSSVYIIVLVETKAEEVAVEEIEEEDKAEEKVEAGDGKVEAVDGKVEVEDPICRA